MNHIFSIMAIGVIGMYNLSAKNLINNGSLDNWSGNIPKSGWKCKQVEPNKEFIEHGTGALFRPNKKSNAILWSPEFKLEPNTEYILSFYYRVPAENSGIRASIEGVKNTSFLLSVPYVHRGGMRIDKIFKTGKTVPAQSRVKFIAGGNGLAIIDEVFLVPLKRAWNRAVFKKIGKNKAECLFTLGNLKDKATKVSAEMQVYDFFNKLLWSKDVNTELSANDMKSWAAPFTIGDVKRYRAVLKYKCDNGVSDEIWSYFNCDVTEGIRKNYSLTEKRWKFQRKKNNSELTKNDWKQVSIPHKVSWIKTGKPDDCFYRLDCSIPKVGKNDKLFLIANGCVLNPKLYINGKLAGKAVGRMPLEADITKFWKNGKLNEILFKIQSQQAAKRKKVSGGHDYLMPHGGHYAGLTDSVKIEVRPAVYTDLLKIETSLKNKEFFIRGRIRNDLTKPGWYTVENSIIDGDKTVLKLPAQKFYLIPFEPMMFKRKSKWMNPHLYFPHDPYLYKLETVVKNGEGKVVDRQFSRFGFREISISGKHVLLNGKKAKFISRLSAPHPAHVYRGEPASRNVLMDRNFRALQQYTRHGMVYGREYPLMGRLPLCRIDIFDEMGFMIRSSFELNMAFTNYKDTYSNTPKMWDDHRRYIEESMRKLWNHPSIIQWDMENETFLCSTQHTYPELYDEFHRLREIVRGNDKTRPVMHDSADPMGDGDIISLHYPLEVSRQFPPNPVFPLIPFEKGKLYSQLNLHPGAFVWNEERPLMLGEDLIELREYPQSLSLFNDEFIYGHIKRSKAFSPEHILANHKALNNMLQILGREYRKREVHSLTVWGCCIENLTDELAREAIVVDQYQQNFFSNEKVERSFSYFHDSLNDYNAEITWTLKGNKGSIIDKGEYKIKAIGGELIQHKFSIKCPFVDKLSSCILELKVIDRNTKKVICSRQQKWQIFPKEKLEVPSGLNICLYDPAGMTTAVFKQAGIKFKKVENVLPKENCKLFIIGKNALINKPNALAGKKLDKYVRDGGKVLVMAQEGRIDNMFPYAPATNNGLYWPVNFVRIPDHPLAKGISNKDLKFWRGNDQLVSSANYYKPFHGNALSVFDGGSMSGFINSPLLDIPWGKGSYILSQLKLTDKYGKEPVVAKLLNNILAYAAEKPYKNCSQELYYLGNKNLRNAVQKCGANVVPISKYSPNSKGELLLLDANYKPAVNEIKKIKQFIKNGGTAWLQGISLKNASNWKTIVGKLDFENYSSSSLIKNGNSKLLPGITNSDLFWSGVPEYDFYGKENEAFDMGQVTTNPPLPVKGAVQLLNHGALQVLNDGPGKIIIDALNWPGNLDLISQRAPRIPSAIMTAHGIKLNPVAGDMRIALKGSYTPVKLNRYYNLKLNGTLPSGKHNFAGIPFSIKGKGKGAILIGSDRLINPKFRFKNKITDIKIDKAANRIYLMLSAFNSYESGRGFGGGSLIGAIKLHYNDSTISVLAIQQKVDCANLFETYGDLKRGEVAWQGLNPFTSILSKYTIWPDDEWIQTSGLNRIYVTHYDNPYPTKKINSISLVSTNQHFVPIIFGMTLFKENK